MGMWLKVLSYWNLNQQDYFYLNNLNLLKVLSYWNLNKGTEAKIGIKTLNLKYYHIGI